MNQVIRYCIITIQFCMIWFYCSPDLLDLVKRYPEVYNTHDVEKIVPLYAADAVFEVVGQVSLQGINQIRDITQYDSVLNIHMSIGDLQRHGDTVFCRLTETNDWLKVAEIDIAYYLAAFVFKKRLITYISAKAEPKTAEAFRQVLTPLMKWARVEKPDILREMMPEGKFNYNALNAGKTLALLKTWKEIQRE